MSGRLASQVASEPTRLLAFCPEEQSVRSLYRIRRLTATDRNGQTLMSVEAKDEKRKNDTRLKRPSDHRPSSGQAAARERAWNAAARTAKVAEQFRRVA